MRAGSSQRSPSLLAHGRDDWLAVVGDCQLLINTLTAVQDAAIAEAARRESVWCEDGTLGESVHGPGRVTLDAADVVAPVIGASHPQAQRRVEQAVRLAAGRVPVPADDRDVPEASGLGRLHEAMAAGRLDGYRASVIAFELEVAPADVADAIVAALAGHLGDDAATLRRRTRVLLHRISPELLRERAKKARAATGLRRWAAEPGVDEWHGTFPSEDAAAAWAAIDRLAHDLVTAGTCTTIEQARGKALTDLVTGNANIDVQVVLTVPAGTGGAHPSRPDRRRPHHPAPTAPTRPPAAPTPSRPDRRRPHHRAQTGGAHTIAASTASGSVSSGTQDQHPTSAEHAPALTNTVATQPVAGSIDDPPPPRVPTLVTHQARRRPRRGARSTSVRATSRAPWLAARPPRDEPRASRVAVPSEPARRWCRATRSPGRGSTRATTLPPTPTDPVTRSRRWCRPATAAAASPDARSPPGPATSTTSGPGRPAPPPHETCSPSADDTIASSNDPAGACTWHPTAPPPGPTPPAENAPPHHWTP